MNRLEQSNGFGEAWDVYDINRIPTGRVHYRGQPQEAGNYHLIVHVCIFNAQGQLLLQKRSADKLKWPALWDVSAAGSALFGEDSRAAAERETAEELGIKISLENIRPRFTLNYAEGFDDYYMIYLDIDLHELRLQEGEVDAVCWAGPEDIERLLAEKSIVPYFFIRQIFHLKDSTGLL